MAWRQPRGDVPGFTSVCNIFSQKKQPPRSAHKLGTFLVIKQRLTLDLQSQEMLAAGLRHPVGDIPQARKSIQPKDCPLLANTGSAACNECATGDAPSRRLAHQGNSYRVPEWPGYRATCERV